MIGSSPMKIRINNPIHSETDKKEIKILFKTWLILRLEIILTLRINKIQFIIDNIAPYNIANQEKRKNLQNFRLLYLNKSKL